MFLPLRDTTDPFYIGAINDGDAGSFLDGKVDNTMFWRRALNSLERSVLWNGGSGVQ